MAKDLRNSKRTQAKILDAAGDLLAEEGLKGFGVNAIAERAGYGKPLLYRYFGDAHAVLNALAKSKADEVKAKLAGMSPPAGSQMSEVVYIQVMFARVLAGDAVLRALFRALLCGELAMVAANALEDIVPNSGRGGDAGAAEAFLLSGVAYVLMLRDSRADCAGMPIKTPTDMAAFERAFVRLSSLNA